jgi:dihydroorotate dehydrogenase electron transfer subunit
MPVDVAAEVIANRPLSSDYNVLALAAPAIAAAAEPGQFVMVKPGTGFDPLLRRPFSVFEVLRDGDGTPSGITILSKRIGVSTSLIFDARAGQRIACLGPLGRPFTVIDPPVEAWMVAGGVGLAPFATLAQSLRARGVKTTLFYGARRAAELFYLDFFRALGVDLLLTTEDGSAGERGRVVAPLDRQLASRPASSPVMIYACGPEGMLSATARTAMTYGRPCQVSVERVMACGLGGCYSCVIPMRSEHGGFHHVRSCIAGPVLAADQILWDEGIRP